MKQLAAAVVNRAAGTLAKSRIGLRDHNIRNTALQALKGVPAQNQYAEMEAIQKWVRNNIRYTYDPYGVELFQSPESQLRDLNENGIAGSDCDDLSALFCALASSVGYPTAVMITGTGRYEHVIPGIAPLFPEDLGATGKQYPTIEGWIPAELTLDVPLGWRNPTWNKWKIFPVD